MYDPALKRMYAKAISELSLIYLDAVHFSYDSVDTCAIDLISRIKGILDDRTLDDPERCRKMKTIVDRFYDKATGTTHDQR